MKPIRIALFGAMAALVALPALAQPGPGAGPGAGPGPRGGRGHAAMFAQLDSNRDGRVTWEEAWGFAQQRFAEADANRDGALTLDEAQNLRLGVGGRWGGRGGPAGQGSEGRQAQRAERHAQMTGMLFRAFDMNRDGRVTLEEISPFAQARFRSLDANGDGAITQDEVPQHHGRRGPGGGAAPAQPATPPAAPAR